MTGGAQLQSYLVGTGLARIGWDVKFVTLKDIMGTSLGSYKDTRARAAWVVRHFLHLVKGTVLLLRSLGNDSEVIVVTGALGVFNGLNVFCAISTGKKLVYRAAHIWDADRSNLGLHLRLRGYTPLIGNGFVERCLYSYTLKHAHVIVANAQYIADVLRRILPHKNIRIIPNGRYIEPIRKCEPSHVLWIARFERAKDPMSFVSLARELPSIPFVMCGFGPRADHLTGPAGDLANLTVLNSVSDETKKNLLAKAFVVVNTSVAEGFPNTLIEAGLNAVPYVSFIDPDEVICRYKLGFHVRSLPELVEKVELLVQDRDLREQIGSNIRAYVEKYHDLRNTVAEYDRLLRSLLRKEAES
jgi:glycosyltransferase involved in cell wall biosynthesis